MVSDKNRECVPVAVLGLGLMGRSIAACLLAAGYRVTGVVRNPAAHASAPGKIEKLLHEMNEEGLLSETAASAVERFRMTSDLGEIADSGVVVESVTEDLQMKRDLLRKVELLVSPDCIFATNTSALPVSLLEEGAIHPERILGVHWDEPAHVTRFMEIIPGKQTSAENLDRIAEFARLWGKEPSTLRKEIRGFITNRISYAMFREACHLVESGVCTMEDVDRSLRNDVGWWMPFAGPFRYMDLMGVEAYHRVMGELLPELSTQKEIPATIRKVVENGGRGISNGHGFYQYTEEEAKAWEERFVEFNYKIRRLTAEYADLASKKK
jgi:3-hydroxybutyryl-CoA dehydrogenase